MNRAAFLDRDGVINQKSPGDGYITRWEEMKLLPGVAKAITLLNRANFRVIIVTNQRCVAKGLLAATELESMHQEMLHELAASGATIDGVYYCPHEEQPPCGCRKPAPGMLFTAAREHDIDIHSSWMIGDSERDVEAGKRAGCKTVQIVGPGDQATGNPDVIARSLLEAISQVLRLEGLDAASQAMDSTTTNYRQL